MSSKPLFFRGTFVSSVLGSKDSLGVGNPIVFLRLSSTRDILLGGASASSSSGDPDALQAKVWDDDVGQAANLVVHNTFLPWVSPRFLHF